MTLEEFNDYCKSLKSVTNVIQWGNSSVWKVGGKIFAICSVWGPGNERKISFKCSDLTYRMMIERDGVIPAPYLARAKWVQIMDPSALSDDDVKAYIAEAHRIIAGKLTRSARRELGL